jgi:hypothetical protein
MIWENTGMYIEITNFTQWSTDRKWTALKNFTSYFIITWEAELRKSVIFLFSHCGLNDFNPRESVWETIKKLNCIFFLYLLHYWIIRNVHIETTGSISNYHQHTLRFTIYKKISVQVGEFFRSLFHCIPRCFHFIISLFITLWLV